MAFLAFLGLVVSSPDDVGDFPEALRTAMGLVLAAAVFALGAAQNRFDSIYEDELQDLMTRDEQCHLSRVHLARHHGQHVWQHAHEWQHILLTRPLFRWPRSRSARGVARLHERVNFIESQIRRYDELSEMNTKPAERAAALAAERHSVSDGTDRTRFAEYAVRYRALGEQVETRVRDGLRWGSPLETWVRVTIVSRDSYRQKLAAMLPIDTARVLAMALVALLVFAYAVGALYAQWTVTWAPSPSWWAVISFILVAAAQTYVVGQFVRRKETRYVDRLAGLLGFRLWPIEQASPSDPDSFTWPGADALSAIEEDHPRNPWALALRGRVALHGAVQPWDALCKYPDSPGRETWELLVRDHLTTARAALEMVLQDGEDTLSRIALARTELLRGDAGLACRKEAERRAVKLLSAAIVELGAMPTAERRSVVNAIRHEHHWLMPPPSNDAVAHKLQRLHSLLGFEPTVAPASHEDN